jgi:class 3 adenylate cyclase
MPKDEIIEMTIRREAARNEKILAWLRFGLAILIIPDLFDENLPAGYLWIDAFCLAYLVGAVLATYRWSIRPWFKYLIMSADAALLYYTTIFDAGIWPADSMFLALGLFVCFLVIAASIRMSRGAVACATGLALADLVLASVMLKTDFVIVFGTSVIVFLMGLLSYFVMTRLHGLIIDVTRKERLSRFLPPELVELAARDPALLRLGGRRQSVTILFADIRGFTPMSETHEPEEVLDFLNDYLRVTTDMIFQHRGTLDKFMGDCIMALFGAPLTNPDDADRAVRAAVDIMERVAEFNRRRAEDGFCPVEIGVGINTADVIAGNIGTERRMEYTVIGDGVNLAARLEKVSKDYDTKIIISGETYERLTDKLGAVPYGGISVKGKDAEVQIYGVPHAILV